ncbi:MAG: type II toxin-antitoxin system RelE/ParE family toxin [Candidatus Aegiribacteria sp.]|nr:type II toxin-antitoxin system RelE/ParE family toxin [Candidatus Aegiribacteria sp.]
MKIIFSTYARLELEDAIHFYDLEYKGLGQQFKTEVRKAASRISEYPEAWAIDRGDIRKCLLHKFPYKLLYSIEKHHVEPLLEVQGVNHPGSSPYSSGHCNLWVTGKNFVISLQNCA